MTAPGFSACGGEVPAAARFCPQCGAAQAVPCRGCGVLNAANHRVWSDFGMNLRTATAEAAPPGAPAAPSPPPAATPRTEHAERRQIAVLFCGLADSTALAQGRDPEDFREIVQGLGGHVAQYLGELALKSIAEPMRAYVLGIDALLAQGEMMPASWEAGGLPAAPPLVGRESETAFLDGAWGSALVPREDRWELRGDLFTGLIPASLRDSLAARLDRLGDGRTVARHAAVVGRRFDASLAGLTPQQADAGLAELVQAGLVYRVDLQTSGERYEFKHALVQAAAYESLLRRERSALHARIAGEIEARMPELVERQPELLAWRLCESQQPVAAAQRWLQTGRRSLARSANQDAIVHLRAWLALAPQLPEGPPEGMREALELALLSTIGPALIATTGFGSAQVGEVCMRARELGALMQDRPEFFPALWGSWVFHLVSGQLAASRGIAEQMLELAQRTDDTAMLVEAHWTLGNALFWMGGLANADAQLALTPTLYDAESHAGNALLYGQDPLVAAECCRSYSLWALGHVDQAPDARAALAPPR